MDFLINVKDKILIVAPHQDDETFGCGGLMAKYGRQCDILLLTDGCLGGIDNYNSESELANIRNIELDEVCKLVGINNIYRLPIRNEELSKNKKIVYDFNIKPYKYIFLPNREEDHPDHKICYKIFSTMKRRQRASAQIYEYEVWTPITMPTVFFDISDVIEIKKEMIKIYVSQLADKDYYNGIIGLNKYRGIYKNNEYCEAYKYSGYNKFSAFIYNLMPEFVKELIRRILSK